MFRITLPSPRAALARPAVLATTTSLALAALLGGGLLVANATDAEPMTAVEATASPAPSSDASSTSADASGSTTSGGDDNVAVANNTRDGSTVYAIRLKVSILNSDPDTVDSGNAAVAVGSCNDCQTVAIALEGVVVTGDAQTVAPENIALAINSGCSNCQTLAYAYQNLQTVDGKARMTGDGRRRVAQLRQQLNALRTSGLDVLAVRAEVNRIAGEFAEILDTTIVPLGKPTSPTPSTSASPGSDAPTTPASRGTTTQPASAAPTPADGSTASESTPQQDDTATPSQPGETTATTAAPQPSPTP